MRKLDDDQGSNGGNVSREHLHFIKSIMGCAVDDWENITWSIVDQGGLCGTFVNTNKIDAKTPFGLNCGDLIGIGCPDTQSSKTTKLEKFVYRIKSPEAFRLQAAAVDVEMESDAPTPHPTT